MSRRKSRESAFKLLYQLEFQKDAYEPQKERFISEMDIDENDLDYFNKLVDGIFFEKNNIDLIYSKFLTNWNLERIPKVDQAILRIAIFEMTMLPDVPRNVSISEAVLLAKKYSTDKSRSYINGILGNIIKTLPEEVK